jgi:uncharacterized membrane protein HdeD (DUF308 family)
MVVRPLDLIADLSRNWWLVALRGVLAILFALLAFFWPAKTLAVLVLLFGAYVLVDGVFALGATFSAIRHNARWWPLLLEALLGIGIGLATFVWPGITALALIYLIAAWAIVTGIFEVIAAIQLRRSIEGEWMLILAGVLSVVFGLLLIVFPGSGALAVLWLFAAYALVFGVVLLVLAFRLRGLKKDLETFPEAPPVGGPSPAV